MIGTKCPGQDMRYWTADDVYDEECPKCGEQVEFFKTDIRLRCPGCKTKMANPRFNMGCAEWCAYAEQCLGPGAKGMKSGSLKTLFTDELEKRTGNQKDEVEIVKDLIQKAEEICNNERIDFLPIVAAIVVVYLEKKNLIDDPDKYFEDLVQENSLPQRAVKEARNLVSSVLKEKPFDEKNPSYQVVASTIKDLP